MKQFLLTLSLMLFPFLAHAQDSWKLYENAGWKVHLSIPEGGTPFCSANSTFFNGESISLLNYGYGPVLHLYASGANFEGILGQADFWVDSNTYWRGFGRGVGDGIFFEEVHQELIEEMFAGRVLYVDLDRDGYSDTSYSLQGSAKALYALAECINRLN